MTSRCPAPSVGTSGETGYFVFSHDEWARGIAPALRINPFRGRRRKLAFYGIVSDHGAVAGVLDARVRHVAGVHVVAAALVIGVSVTLAGVQLHSTAAFFVGSVIELVSVRFADASVIAIPSGFGSGAS